jgi:hypothetical protein
VTNSSIEPNKRELGIVGQEPILRILPAAFGEYRSLFSIHLRRILEIEKKHPIHAVALLVAVACETLSKTARARRRRGLCRALPGSP